MGVSALILAAALATPAPTLAEAVTLARGGAPTLALSLLDALQQDPSLARADWVAAERERTNILAAASDWRALDARLAALPADLPEPFVAWAAERRAEALLALGDGPRARTLVAGLLWAEPPPDDDVFRALRLLVVRSYLVEGDRDAALTALARYSQDYGPDDPVLRTLHGETLLAAGRAADAVHVLGDDDGPLRWLAALHAGERPAAAVFERAVRAGSVRDGPPAQRRAAWRVVADAAGGMGNRQAVVAALERALAIDPHPDRVPELLEPSAAALWEAYHEWGRALGNAAHLMVGVDAEWLMAAEQATDDPAEARALLAAVARDTRDPGVAADAHARFTRLLAREPAGGRVLAALYFDANPFSAVAAIPAGARYALVEPALARRDYGLAADVVADLAPPPDADASAWELRRARILVLAGRYADGAAVLQPAIDAAAADDLDRVLQVLFDLQAVDAHAEAVDALRRVAARDDLPLQLRREVHYWMADSYRALDEPREAARHYLRSATLADPYAMDPWAQTARYQAAAALESGGLHDDAVTLLESLANATDDEPRRARLLRRIEEVRRAAAR